MSERNSEVDTEELDGPDFVEGGASVRMDDDDDDLFTDTLILESASESSDNVGGASVELDVEQLLAEVEAESHRGVDASGRVRRRLEAILERKRRHADLLDFDEYDLDS